MAETKGRECFNIFNVGKKSSKQINEKKYSLLTWRLSVTLVRIDWRV